MMVPNIEAHEKAAEDSRAPGPIALVAAEVTRQLTLRTNDFVKVIKSFNTGNVKRAQRAATEAARSVSILMRRHLARTKRAHSVTQHDIKLELDVRSQKLIERALRSAFPDVALLGEEGISGKVDSEFRWVVDPID